MRSLSISLTTVACLAGCATQSPAEQPVSLNFALVAGEQPVRCGTVFGPVGRDQKRVSLRDARFYVQDVALIDDTGKPVPLRLQVNDWQDTQVALLDFEDGSAHCVGGSIPAGRYRGVSVTLGVPQSLNHTSTELQGAPLDLAAMGWSWQAGRKFIKLEVDPEGGVSKADGSRANTWYLHLGSTGCSGNPVTGETVACQRANRIPLRFEGFDPVTQAVVLDVAALLRDSRLAVDEGAAVGCMSGPTDPECVAVFKRLGVSLSSGSPLEPGYSPAFSVRARP